MRQTEVGTVTVTEQVLVGWEQSKDAVASGGLQVQLELKHVRVVFPCVDPRLVWAKSESESSKSAEIN